MQEIGNLVYLYTLDLKNNLAIRQELIKSRFCKIVESIPVKGGKKDEQYMQYKLESICDGTVYTINNYLSSYEFCDLTELEEAIDKVSHVLVEENLEKMKQVITDIKNIYNEKA